MSAGAFRHLLGEPPVELLVIAPHPDDAEIGMGATIAKLTDQGRRVGVLELTDGEPTPVGDPETRLAEATAAGRVLGLAWRACLGLPNRSLTNDLEARWLIAAWIRRLRPTTVALPYWIDYHPDHTAAVPLIEAACFWARLSRCDLPGQPHRVRRLVYYYSIHLRQPVQPAFLVDVSQHIERKLQALRCYRSQLDPAVRGPDVPVTPEELETAARYWGWLARCAHAEPFAVRTPLLIAHPEQFFC